MGHAQAIPDEGIAAGILADLAGQVVALVTLARCGGRTLGGAARPTRVAKAAKTRVARGFDIATGLPLAATRTDPASIACQVGSATSVATGLAFCRTAIGTDSVCAEAQFVAAARPVRYADTSHATTTAVAFAVGAAGLSLAATGHANTAASTRFVVADTHASLLASRDRADVELLAARLARSTARHALVVGAAYRSVAPAVVAGTTR